MYGGGGGDAPYALPPLAPPRPRKRIGGVRFGAGTYAGVAAPPSGIVVPPTTVTIGGTGSRVRTAQASFTHVPANDNWASAVAVTGQTGSVGFTTYGASVESAYPLPTSLANPGGDVWFSWSPTADGNATFTYPTTHGFDIYVVPPSPASPAIIAEEIGGAGTVTTFVRAGESYKFRLYPLAVANAADGLTASWNVVPRPFDMTLLQPTIAASPGILQVNIANARPNETISFTIDSTALTPTATVDADGTLANFPLATPALANGAHTLHASGSTGDTGQVGFTVAVSGPSTYYPPDPLPPGAPAPAPQTAVGGVLRWQLNDPTNASVWQFPINPNSEDGTIAPRTVAVYATTSPDGQALVFEGDAKAKRWVLKGDVLTLADKTALEAWAGKPYRVYLADDFGHVWSVKVTRVACIPVHDTSYPEHHSYTITALLYGKVI